MTRDERVALVRERFGTGFFVGDGAMGTTLNAAGHSAGESLELYNVERPDTVRAAHRAYLQAGAEMIETNTFQGSSVALAHYGLGSRARELNLAGAARAREAAGDGIPVVGCIGPTGGILEPYGDLELAEAEASFQEEAQALADGGVDLFIVETFTAIEEALLAVAAAVATGLPVAASMSFDPNGHTAFGVTPRRAAEALAEAGAVVVGANCGTISPAEMVEILAGFREATDLPLISQPNAGRPERRNGGVVFPEPPEVFAAAAPRFLDLGAVIVGGCCGTTAGHIRAVAERLRGTAA